MGNTTTSGRSKDGYVAVEIPGMNYGEKEESKRLSGLEYGTFKLPLRGETVVTETKCLCNQFDSIDIQSEDAWDLCFIVSINKEPDDEAKSDEELMMDELKVRFEKLGLEMESYKSVQEDELILLIRAPQEVLERIAGRPEYEMPVLCDEGMLKKLLQEMPRNFPDANIDAIEIPYDEDESRLEPHKYIYAPYTLRHEPKLGRKGTAWKWAPQEKSFTFKDVYKGIGRSGLDYTDNWDLVKRKEPVPQPFGTVKRIKLLRTLLELPEDEGGGGIVLSSFLAKGFSVFPCHTPAQRDALAKKWLQDPKVWLGWMQPCDLMKEYLGERVTLYFAFLGNHCRWLAALGILGTLVEIVVVLRQNTEHWSVGIFAIIVAIWSTLFTEYWKRRESWYQMKWGMSDFEQQEEPRAAFIKVSELRPSIVNGEPERVYINPGRNTRMRIWSKIIIFFVVIAVLALNIGIYWLKILMRNSDNAFLKENYSYIFSGILSVAISVVNIVYTDLAVKLTENENHRTETEHKDSLINKLFVVQFINSFVSLYYTGFVQKELEGTCDGYLRCMDDLCILVSTILAERLMFTILYDTILPKITAYQKFKAETEGVDVRKFSYAETQYILDPYDAQMEMINRYMDQVMMFGYMVLFVTAFPMSPLLGFVSNILQIHQFGNMLLYSKQRNMPFGVQDIGSFQGCFETVAAIAVITNSALIFFTLRDVYFGESSWLPTLSTTYIVWLFFLLQATIFGGIALIREIVPDVVEEVSIQLERQKFIVSKLFSLTPDDNAALPDRPLEGLVSPKLAEKGLLLINQD